MTSLSLFFYRDHSRFLSLIFTCCLSNFTSKSLTYSLFPSLSFYLAFVLFLVPLVFLVCLPLHSLLVYNSALLPLRSLSISILQSLSLRIFLLPQFAPTSCQSLSSLIVLPVASSPLLHFIFRSSNLSQSLLPSSLPIPHGLPTSLPHSSFSLSIFYRTILLILRSWSNLLFLCLFFSFISRILSLSR